MDQGSKVSSSVGGRVRLTHCGCSAPLHHPALGWQKGSNKLTVLQHVLPLVHVALLGLAAAGQANGVAAARYVTHRMCHQGELVRSASMADIPHYTPHPSHVRVLQRKTKKFSLVGGVVCLQQVLQTLVLGSQHSPQLPTVHVMLTCTRGCRTRTGTANMLFQWQSWHPTNPLSLVRGVVRLEEVLQVHDEGVGQVPAGRTQSMCSISMLG